MAEPTLRPATPADAAAIAEVHVRSWQVGYRGIVAKEVLAAQSVQAREREWFGWLSDGATDVNARSGEPTIRLSAPLRC
jgi:hypothetical protein